MFSFDEIKINRSRLACNTEACLAKLKIPETDQAPSTLFIHGQIQRMNGSATTKQFVTFMVL
jgi:hypothetical protein